MKKYFVSFMCVYSDEVEAESPEEAAEIVGNNCPLDIDGSAYVTDIETDEQFEVQKLTGGNACYFFRPSCSTCARTDGIGGARAYACEPNYPHAHIASNFGCLKLLFEFFPDFPEICDLPLVI